MYEKTEKDVVLDERQKRLMLYLSLLASAIFLALWDPSQLWFVIGLGVGVLYGLANDWIFNKTQKTNRDSRQNFQQKNQKRWKTKKKNEAPASFFHFYEIHSHPCGNRRINRR